LRRWEPQNPHRGVLHTLRPGFSLDSFRKFSEQGLIIFDEAGGVCHSPDMLVAFAELAREFQKAGISVLLSYPRAPGALLLEEALPSMKTVRLLPRVSQKDAIETITGPLEGTGVEISDSAMNRVLTVSEGHPTIICACMRYLIQEHTRHLLDSGVVVLGEEPLTRRNFLTRALDNMPILYDGLKRGLNNREKKLLESLVRSEDPSGYEAEMKELQSWGLIGNNLEVGLPIEIFVNMCLYDDLGFEEWKSKSNF